MDVMTLSWIIFGSIVTTLIVLDLGVFNKKDEVMSLKHSALLSLFYISIGCCFGIYIYYEMGAQNAADYFTGFLLEKTMALDNIFVISMIFSFFKIPPQYQHRVLFWGILGVIVLRAILISLGSIILSSFSWMLFIFGAILIYTGYKMLRNINGHSLDINNLYLYQLAKRKLNIQNELDGNKFVVKRDGKLYFTPLFMALIAVETADLIFAIDSIPAIFAITQNSFVVYTSNIFAILGLRALFFCLADVVQRFKYIKYSLSIILILIGIKIFVAHFVKIPAYIPLTVIFGLLTAGIIISIYKSKKIQQT
ncbi:MAG: TerC/Alx family metal homeostasis membrane protein [Rickettsiales bacterium]|nr:MAG: TerC/Alx family metal homeostasis membrane protein [Rickettsiales bacterium]